MTEKIYLTVIDVTWTPEEWDDESDTSRLYFPTWAPMPGKWDETSSCEDRTSKYVAMLSEDDWTKLSEAWRIDPEDSEPNLGMITEYGHLESMAFNWDGMDWNIGGWTPIEYVTMYVSEGSES